MLIDLTEVIKNENGKLDICEDFHMPEISFMGEEFEFSKPFKAVGCITNNSKALELAIEVSGKAKVHCARCAAPLEVTIQFPVKETLMREDETNPEDDEIILYKGKEIELDDIIVSNFLVNVPVKYLCREDCKGLCPHCGTNLNEHTCDCDKDVLDPRWEKLAEIMKNMTDTK
ncbi:MAG: DUF177 domain-containing protein [Firmicutes bacterium]|nr:DUF177 domain-containing protein [Bacillota bacterium]